MKNILIFFYFLYESRKPLYKIFRDIENFYLKYPEAGIFATKYYGNEDMEYVEG